MEYDLAHPEYFVFQFRAFKKFTLTQLRNLDNTSNNTSDLNTSLLYPRNNA